MMDTKNDQSARDDEDVNATVPDGPPNMTIANAPLESEGNATVLGAPLADALKSLPSSSSTTVQTELAVEKTVTDISQEVKTAAEMTQRMPPSPVIAPPPKSLPKEEAQGIPVLPVALGAGAIIAGIVLFAVVLGSSKELEKVQDSPLVPVPTNQAEAGQNRWIRVEGASGKVLGISDNDAPPSVRGFRPVYQVLAPMSPFEMQQHEVTWGELDPWIEKNPGFAFPKPTTGLTSADTRRSLPAFGVPWNTALEYCRSLGGTLPTEEQWELAARGAKLNKFPWGNTNPDWSRVHAFKGEMVGPAKVMSNEQDRTEGPPDAAIHDLAGNVQEWTFSVWREDTPDGDVSWVQDQGITVQTIRGFPLARDVPGRIDELSIAYRDWVCASGDCSPLNAGASMKERARKPRLELWARADSTQPGAVEWRRVIEKPAVTATLTRCFSGPTTTDLTIKATRTSFCKRPDQAVTAGSCDGQPALSGSLAQASGALPPTTLKCVNHALHEASAANVIASLPDAQFTYALYLSTDPRDALKHVGFRCVRDAARK